MDNAYDPEGAEEEELFPTAPGYTNYPNHRRSSGPQGSQGSIYNTVSAAELERDLHPNEDPVTRAKRLLREGVDGAASVLLEIALHGSTEKLRLDAAKLILDRVLGPVSNVQPDTQDSPLEQLFAELDRAANGG